MFIQAIRRTMLFAALAALPSLAVAAGSQAGDNGRLPIGADNEGPRQAIPNAMTNDGNLYYYDGPTYYGGPRYVPRYYAPPTYYVPHTYYIAPSSGTPLYVGPTYDQWDISFCDRQPLAERAACRDAAVAGYRPYVEYRYYPEYHYYYPR